MGVDGGGGDHAVGGGVVDPEDFAAAGCDAEVGRKVGKGGGEGWGSSEGRTGLRLKSDTDDVEGSHW